MKMPSLFWFTTPSIFCTTFLIDILHYYESNISLENQIEEDPYLSSRRHYVSFSYDSGEGAAGRSHSNLQLASTTIMSRDMS